MGRTQEMAVPIILHLLLFPMLSPKVMMKKAATIYGMPKAHLWEANCFSSAASIFIFFFIISVTAFEPEAMAIMATTHTDSTCFYFSWQELFIQLVKLLMTLKEHLFHTVCIT